MKEVRFLASMLTPRSWAALLLAAVLLFAAGLGLGCFMGHRIAAGQAEIAALKVASERADERLAHARALAAEVDKVAAIEQQWKDDLGDVAELHRERMEDAEKKMDALRADVLTGAVRLSVAVKKAGAAAGHCAAADDPAAAGGDQEARAELMPATANALVGIATDGDRAVLDLNACIDSYEAIRQKGQP